MGRLSLSCHSFVPGLSWLYWPHVCLFPLSPLMYRHKWRTFKGVSSSMLLHKFFFDPYDLNDLFPSPIKGWVPFRDITGVFRALTLPFWFPFSRPLL